MARWRDFFFHALRQDWRLCPPGAPSIFDLQLAFTPQRFQFVVEQWGAAATQNYVTGMWMDYIYPVAYSLALAGFIAWLTVRPNQPPARWQLTLFSLLLIAGLLDWIENTLHLLMLAVLHATPSALVFIAPLAAAIKWTLAAISILAIFAFAVLRTATFIS